VLACFAERAATLDCAQPELVDEPMLLIDGGRHPVVERAGREPFMCPTICASMTRAAC
jgi:DNA mismatch repair protein MutS